MWKYVRSRWKNDESRVNDSEAIQPTCGTYGEISSRLRVKFPIRYNVHHKLGKGISCAFQVANNWLCKTIRPCWKRGGGSPLFRRGIPSLNYPSIWQKKWYAGRCAQEDKNDLVTLLELPMVCYTYPPNRTMFFMLFLLLLRLIPQATKCNSNKNKIKISNVRPGGRV